LHQSTRKPQKAKNDATVDRVFFQHADFNQSDSSPVFSCVMHVLPTIVWLFAYIPYAYMSN
jgi:hypothetical protein